MAWCTVFGCAGKAEWYRNRHVGSRALSAARGLPDFIGPDWAGRDEGPNTNVGGLAGTTWAMVEAGGTPVELTYELESVARNDFFGTLPGAFTAHPKIDPSNGPKWTTVHDVPNATTELVVVDAQDFAGGPVARVVLPQRVPCGFHGNWVSDRAVPPPASPPFRG